MSNSVLVNSVKEINSKEITPLLSRAFLITVIHSQNSLQISPKSSHQNMIQDGPQSYQQSSTILKGFDPRQVTMTWSQCVMNNHKINNHATNNQAMTFEDSAALLTPPKQFDLQFVYMRAGDIESNPGPPKSSSNSSPRSRSSPKSKSPHKSNPKSEVLVCASIDQTSNKQLGYTIKRLGPDNLKCQLKSKSLMIQEETRQGIVKSFIESKEYQHILLNSPTKNILFCYGRQQNYVCLFHELDQTKHEVVIQVEVKALYSVGIATDFSDLKKILLQGSQVENGVVGVPWSALTRSQMLSLAKEKCNDLTSCQAMQAPNTRNFLSAKIKGSKLFKNQFGNSGNLETNFVFDFSPQDPLVCCWSQIDDSKTRQNNAELQSILQFKGKRLPPQPRENVNIESTATTSEDQRIAEVGVRRVEEARTEDEDQQPGSCLGEEASNTDPTESGAGNGEENDKKRALELEEALLNISDITASEPDNELDNMDALSISILPSVQTRTQILDDTLQSYRLTSDKKEVDQDIDMRSKQEGLLQCFVCNFKTSYQEYNQGHPDDPIPEHYFSIATQHLKNHKWFCDKCNNMDIQTILNHHLQTPKVMQDNSQEQLLVPYMNTQLDTTTHMEANTNTNDLGHINKRLDIAQDTHEIVEKKLDILTESLEALKSSWLEHPVRPSTSHSYREAATDRAKPSQHAIQRTIQINPAAAVETSVDPKRTVVINNVEDISLVRSSGVIKKNITKLYGDMTIMHSFVTKGGSIFVELESEEDADYVKCEWKSHYFTSDSSRKDGAHTSKGTSCIKLADLKLCILAKNVDTEITDEDIKKSIIEAYPSATVKRFIRRNGDRMTTIKVDFSTQEDHEKCLAAGSLKMNHQSWPVVQFEPKQRIIQCFKCYKFGHVAKLCNQKTQRCDLCSKNHHQGDCRFLNDENRKRFKCINCGGQHEATFRGCQSYKTIVEKMRSKSSHINNHG